MKRKATISIYLFILCYSNVWVLNAQPNKILYSNYKVDFHFQEDTALNNLILPYKDSLNVLMNKVIGFTTTGLFKHQPESNLGNLVADCIRLMAEKKFEKKVDIGLINFGSIRSYVPKGEIKVRKIFELIPYDNQIVLINLNGITLEKLLDKTAEKNGWCVSGMKMGILNYKAVDVMINEKPLEANKMYCIALTDYLANGGDELEIGKKIIQEKRNVLLRDALIEYISSITENSLPIDLKIEKRVIYVNE